MPAGCGDGCSCWRHCCRCSPRPPRTPSHVIAFYNGTWGAAHISFVEEANRWFPATAAANNFSYTSTNDWERLSTITPDQYQVVLVAESSRTADPGGCGQVPSHLPHLPLSDRQ